MTAPIDKSQFAFELPNLSYIDVSLEEPNLRGSVLAPHRHGLAQWTARQITALNEWRRQYAARNELDQMTDHELSDIGLSRSDLARVFDADHNGDLVNRGYMA
jgi:uncharacterized protein YjiS (DUF1127 family)